MLLASLTGGIVGFFGNAVNKYFSNKELAIKNQHELDILKAKSELMRAEADAQVRVEQTISNRVIQEGELGAFSASLKFAEKSLYNEALVEKLLDMNIVCRSFGIILIFLSGLIDIFRQLIRPAVTFGSLFANILIFWWVLSKWMESGGFSNLSSGDLFNYFIMPCLDLLIFIVSTSVGYWFGSRDIMNSMKGRLLKK